MMKPIKGQEVMEVLGPVVETAYNCAYLHISVRVIVCTSSDNLDLLYCALKRFSNHGGITPDSRLICSVLPTLVPDCVACLVHDPSAGSHDPAGFIFLVNGGKRESVVFIPVGQRVVTTVCDVMIEGSGLS